MSNEIHLILPLKLNQISLPDPALRDQNRDLYDEFICIQDNDYEHLKKSTLLNSIIYSKKYKYLKVVVVYKLNPFFHS